MQARRFGPAAAGRDFCGLVEQQVNRPKIPQAGRGRRRDHKIS